MKNETILKFLSQLSADYFLFAPQKLGENLQSGYEYGIKEVSDLNDIDWSGAMPYGSWKELLLPNREKLFEISGHELKEAGSANSPIALVGVNVLDLKVLTLFELVFANDKYYQKRRQNMLIIGYSTGLPSDYKKYRVFSHNYEENILEHVVFDIFIAKQSNGRIKFYAGSEKGQKTLDQNKIADYYNIKFAGAVPERGLDSKMKTIIAKMETSFGKKVWDELDQRCIACGKCSIACPTCFCFDFEDKSDPENSSRQRKWGSCFYNDFSLVAGGNKELNTIKKKIFFWYFHKFVRIPKEYVIPGCVGCNRCVKACPVGIDINETLKSL